MKKSGACYDIEIGLVFFRRQIRIYLIDYKQKSTGDLVDQIIFRGVANIRNMNNLLSVFSAVYLLVTNFSFFLEVLLRTTSV